MSPLIYAAATVASAIAAAVIAAPTRQLETEIRIDASPAAVWAVLTDGAAYKDWNPFIRSMTGRLEQGARLENVMQPLGQKAHTFRPVVLVAEPDRELRWLGRLPLPRLFDAEHYFRLEAQGSGTRLVHGERFRGILLWLIDVGQFRASFEAMNAGLKARAEGAPVDRPASLP